MTKQEFLAMSLPYGLKCCTVEINRINDLISCHFGNIVIARIKPNDNIDIPLPIAQIKPFLHPLSDLTKEIEHKGERFMPIEKLGEIIGGGWCGVYERAVELMQEWDIDTLKDKIKHLPFEFIQLFISWYFDVADLISKGDAIDVNTLDVNPYK